ncbi:MAG: hypothetical protein AAB254_02155 [candidate division NC10 bacterium]
MAMADWAVFGGFLLVAGLLVLLAVALGGILFSYIADEEAKGRRIEWLEEPLAMGGEPEQVEREIFQKAA